MPLCYGGGIKTVDQAETIIGLGVEKVAISSAAMENPELITIITKRIGNQSVVVVLYVKKNLLGDMYEAWTHNGKKRPANVHQSWHCRWKDLVQVRLL